MYHAVSGFACLWLGYSCLNHLDDFAAGLQGVIFCKYVTNILHTGFNALCHKAKQPVGTKKHESD